MYINQNEVKFFPYSGHSYFNTCMMTMTDTMSEGNKLAQFVHTKGNGGITPEKMKPGVLSVFINHYYIYFINYLFIVVVILKEFIYL